MKCTAVMEDGTENIFYCKSMDSFFVPRYIDLDKVDEIKSETEGTGPRCFYGIDKETRKICK